MERVKSFGYLDIFWEESSRSLISQWKGGAANRDLRAGLDAGLEEFKRRPAGTQWIGETTHIGLINDADQEWTNTDWIPRFLATGVKYMAVVQPASAIAKLNVNSILQVYEGTNLTVFNCATLSEAIDWMKSVNLAGEPG